MAYALVGSRGAISTGASGAAVTPAWGTGENRTANDLLICQVAVDGAATVPSTPAGWSLAVSTTGTSTASVVFFKVAASSDAAPTIGAVTGGVISAMLSEWSGGATSSPLNQSGTAGGTTSPLAATAGAVDAAAGELVITAAAVFYSSTAGGARTITDSLNNGATTNDTTNASTSTVDHYAFADGITTGKSAADSDSLTFTTSHISGVALVLASFKLGAQTLSQALTAGLSFSGAVPRATTKGLAAAGLSFAGAQQKATARAVTARLSFMTAGAASCHFDGSTGFITCPDSTAFRTPSTQVFLGAWFRFTSATQIAGARIAGKLVSGSPFVSYLLQMDGTANSLKVLAGVGLSSAGLVQTTSIGPLTNNAWYFAAMSWQNGGALVLNVYDSTLTQVFTTSLNTGSGNALVYDASAFEVGADASGATFLNGDVGSVILTATASTGATDDINYAKCVPANFPASPDFDSGLCAPGSLSDLSSNGATFTTHGTVTTGGTSPYTLCAATSSALTKGITKSVPAAVLSFSGARAVAIAHALPAAVLSFAGSLTKSVVKTALAAALSFSGALTVSRLRMVALSAALSFAGAPSRGVGKGVSGGLSFTGAQSQTIGKGVAGALAFSGALRRSIAHTLTAAALSFSGAVTRGIGHSLAAGLSFVGALGLGTGRGLAASLSFSGTQRHSIGKSISGMLSFTGVQTRTIAKTVTAASLSFSGAVGKGIAHALSAALGFAGSLAAVLGTGAQHYAQLLTASLSFTGSQTKSIGKGLVGALSFSGARAVVIGKTVVAMLSFTGARSNAVGKVLSGALSVTGQMTKGLSRTLNGVLAFSGIWSKGVGKGLAGGLLFVGSLTITSVLHAIVAGTVKARDFLLNIIKSADG